MKIISISGLDGSGKSTQIDLLKQYLESQGKKVFYFHTNQFSISKTYNILRPHKVIMKKHNESVPKAGWTKIQLRKLALSIDIKRFEKLLRKLEKESYDFILSDRYFYDNVININYLSKADSFFNLSIRRPDKAFYLSVDPGEIMKRERVPDQGVEYLIGKKELLDKLAHRHSLEIIDGNRDKKIIFEEIKSKIT